MPASCVSADRNAGERLLSNAVCRQVSTERPGTPPGSTKAKAMRFSRFGVTRIICSSSEEARPSRRFGATGFDNSPALDHAPMAYSVGRLTFSISASQVMMPQQRRSGGRLSTAPIKAARSAQDPYASNSENFDCIRVKLARSFRLDRTRQHWWKVQNSYKLSWQVTSRLNKFLYQHNLIRSGVTCLFSICKGPIYYF